MIFLLKEEVFYYVGVVQTQQRVDLLESPLLVRRYDPLDSHLLVLEVALVDNCSLLTIPEHFVLVDSQQ